MSIEWIVALLIVGYLLMVAGLPIAILYLAYRCGWRR